MCSQVVSSPIRLNCSAKVWRDRYLQYPFLDWPSSVWVVVDSCWSVLDEVIDRAISSIWQHQLLEIMYSITKIAMSIGLGYGHKSSVLDTVQLVIFKGWNFRGLEVSSLFLILVGSNYYKDHWLFSWTVTDHEKREIKPPSKITNRTVASLKFVHYLLVSRSHLRTAICAYMHVHVHGYTSLVRSELKILP